MTVEDGHILGDQGAPLVSVKRTRLWFDLLPLLRKEFRLRRIELIEPNLSIERSPEGGFNVERLKRARMLFETLHEALLSGGTLHYADTRSGAKFEATDIDLAIHHIQLVEGSNPQSMKGLSLEAQLACKELRTKDVSVSGLEASVIGRDGVFELEPLTMQIFGGQMTGRLQADCSGPVPRCQIRCSLPRFRIEEFLETLSPERAAVGPMDFSASLSMQGTTLREMVQTSTGEASLRGDGLVLEGHDLDRELSRFKSSQNFNLVDVGAVFFAGPLGLGVTRGYSFSSLFRGAGGRSRIRTLRSNWSVERGVARAKDVAMATSKNRIALQGGLDFVHGRFADVTVAAIDANGCARVRQVIHGPFANPTVDKPNVFQSLAGPVIKVYKMARHLFPAGHCEVFYSGSVAAPG